MRMRSIATLFLFSFALAGSAQQADKTSPTSDADKPRVYITDSNSWQMSGSSGGAMVNGTGAFGGSTRGGARPQTAEIIKKLMAGTESRIGQKAGAGAAKSTPIPPVKKKGSHSK